MLECVINISEGGNPALLQALSTTLGSDLLDLHSDADHNRSVFTLAGTDSARVLTREALKYLTFHNTMVFIRALALLM